MLLVLPVVFFANAYLRGENCDCVLGEESNAWGLVGMMALVALVKAVFSYLEQYFGHLVAFKALELLRGEAYRSIAPQTPAIVARSHTGDLLDRLTKDIDRIEVFFAHTFAPAVSAVVVRHDFLASPLADGSGGDAGVVDRRADSLAGNECRASGRG